MEKVLTVNNITKIYGKQKALDNVSLEFEKGKIYGLIGNNGAGKTTLLKILCGLAKATDGNYHFTNQAEKVKIGALIEKPGLFGDMTAFDNLKAKAIAIGYKCDNQEIQNLLEMVGLGDVGKKAVSKFSLGMKQRLGIALALVGNPPIILLDEPVNGLDVQGVIDIRNLLLKIRKELQTTMIISSHMLDELARTADILCFIKQGKIVETETEENLLNKYDCKSLEECYLKINSIF